MSHRAKLAPMLRLSSVLAMLFVIVAAPMAWGAASAGGSFIVLCYHDIQDHDAGRTADSNSTEKLVQDLTWLQHNGYRFVSLDKILAARDGGSPLPEKAVLLTFDDGFESFYTRVFAILKTFGAPAVLALNGAWMEGKPGSMVAYGDIKVPRETFLKWDQVRELVASGLVEIASHTRALHRGIPANPQADSEPAAVTRERNEITGGHESDTAYQERLDADAAAMARMIEHETGRAPRALVWPYGEYNGLALSAAAANGMAITFTLIDAVATPENLAAVPRYLITPSSSIANIAKGLRGVFEDDPVRVVQVDLDYVYDADPAQQERNLHGLIQRIKAMSISTVFLQAFADPGGTGLVKQVYFPNRHLPMRADLFNHVSWQLRTLSGVKVFAWMPVLAFDFGDTVATVLAWNPDTGQPRIDPTAYRRVSPFDSTGRRKILELYEDLARAAPFAGLLFHDDAQLSDFEDASPPAFAAYAGAGLPPSIAAIRADPAAMQRWTKLKTETLIAFTQELAEHARRYRSPLETARNIYAQPVLNPRSEAWFAQSFDRFLKTYDYTAVMAMPLMEGVPAHDMESWLKQIVGIVATRPQGLRRTIFELQAVDWRKRGDDPDRRVPTEMLAHQMCLLSHLGAQNFGYYPDDFIKDSPDTMRLHRDFALQSSRLLSSTTSRACGS